MKAHFETHFENENIQGLYQLTLAAAAVGKVRSFLKAHCWKREREMLKKIEGRDFWGP